MKRIMTLTLLLAAALALTGCAAREPDAVIAPGFVRISDGLTAETPSGFHLSESNDLMSLSGLYYAAWAAGEGKTITNAQGQEANAYDAQIFVLVKLHSTAAEAEADIADWMEREMQAYQIGAEKALTAGDQAFRVLPLMEAAEGNPYRRGLAAFAIRGADTLTVELLCADAWTGNPDAALQAFLEGFHYSR